MHSSPRPIALVLVAIILFSPVAARAQLWQRIGLQGIAVNAIARSGSTLIASGPQALYSSADDGATWPRLAGFGGFRHLETDGEGLVVAASTTILAISTDAGANWTLLRDAALRDSLGVIWEHAVLPDGAIVLGTTTDVLVSSDRGASWQARNTGLPAGSPHVGALAVTPDGGLVGGTQGILGGNVYLSTPGVGEWLQIFTKPQTQTGEPTAVFATAQGTILAAISERGIIRTDDEGATWTDATAEIDGRETIYAFEANGGELFAVTSFGRLLASLDDGRTWTLAMPYGLAPGGAQSFLALGPNHYLAGTSSGVFELRGPAGADDDATASVHGVRLAVAPVPSHDGALRLMRSSATGSARYEVIDGLGGMVRSGSFENGSTEARIEGLSSGSYIVRLIEGGETSATRAVVAR